LTDFPYHAEPEGADGERTPTFYLRLKNYIIERNHSPKIVEIRIDPDILIIVEEKMSERKYMVRAECPWYSVLIKKLSLSLLWDQAQGEVGGRA